MELGSGRLLRPALIAGGLLGANLILAAGLAVSALRPRPVLVVPSSRAAGELLPGSVPEETAREFALRYVLHFDNFTPSTLEATHRVLQRMISARAWSGATQALEKRKQVVQEGRMSSQVIPVTAKSEGLKVTVEAVRRTFISDKLSREVRVRYELTLEQQPPTEPNPFGLGIVSQDIREEAGSVERDKP